MTPLETMIVIVLLGLLGAVGTAVAAFVLLTIAPAKPRRRVRLASVPPVLPPVERITPLAAMGFPPPSPSTADVLIYPSSERAPAAASERRPPALPPLPPIKLPPVPPPARVRTRWAGGHAPAGRFGSYSTLPLFAAPDGPEVGALLPPCLPPPGSRASAPMDREFTRDLPQPAS